MDKKKLLIFGAGGFVGRYLAQEFIDHGYDVVGTDKVNGDTLTNKMKFVEADLMDSVAVDSIISTESPDIIINLAAISSVGASWGIPQTTMMVNVVGALNILESARKMENKPRIMFIGSSEEYRETDKPISESCELDGANPYGISKLTQERFVKLYRDQYSMKIYYVRPFNHTGVGQKESFVLPSWCKQVAEIEKGESPAIIKVGNLKVKRDFSHVKDIVRAYRMIVESDNCEIVYNVGSGKAYPLEEMLQYIVSFSSKEIIVEEDQARIRPTDQAMICCDHNMITEDLGWEPQYTVFDALKEMYQWYSK